LVIGPDDPVLRRDATAMGATYVSEPLDESALASEVARLLAPARAAWVPAEPTWTSPFEQPAATSWWVAGDARGSTLH
jgi:hypothetical protein